MPKVLSQLKTHSGPSLQHHWPQGLLTRCQPVPGDGTLGCSLSRSITKTPLHSMCKTRVQQNRDRK